MNLNKGLFLDEVENLVGSCLKLSANAGVSVAEDNDGTTVVTVVTRAGKSHGMMTLKYSEKKEKVLITGMNYAGKFSDMDELLAASECIEAILEHAAKKVSRRMAKD